MTERHLLAYALIVLVAIMLACLEWRRRVNRNYRYKARLRR